MSFISYVPTGKSPGHKSLYRPLSLLGVLQYISKELDKPAAHDYARSVTYLDGQNLVSLPIFGNVSKHPKQRQASVNRLELKYWIRNISLTKTSPCILLSPIFGDVSVHEFSVSMAEEQLDMFRRTFVSILPFVHIPAIMSASELRDQKPFLWLVIMCLNTKMVARSLASNPATGV